MAETVPYSLWVECPDACIGSGLSGLRLSGRRLCDTPGLAPVQFILAVLLDASLTVGGGAAAGIFVPWPFGLAIGGGAVLFGIAKGVIGLYLNRDLPPFYVPTGELVPATF